MEFTADVLRYDEQAIMRLRTLYRQFGYSQYRMSRFEEYGLYAENKAFLASGDIITFTGAGGKLMALRPDVTLSIVKNTKEDGKLKKLYYNENVYRRDGLEFKEQMQVGLECIGHIDVYSMGEVIMLARRSLETLGQRFCLDISHLGFVNGLLRDENLAPDNKTALLRVVSERNIHELEALCRQFGLGKVIQNALASLASLYGPFYDVINDLRSVSMNEETNSSLCELEDVHRVLTQLGAEKDVNLDFSIVNDLSYYSGLIFQGYIDGIPAKILSGGRYDKLMRKFGKASGAVGFAVYLEMLEQISPPRNGATVDVMLTYGDDTSAEKLAQAVSAFTAQGQSVCVQRSLPDDVKYDRLVEM